MRKAFISFLFAASADKLDELYGEVADANFLMEMEKIYAMAHAEGQHIILIATSDWSAGQIEKVLAPLKARIIDKTR